MAAKPNKKRVNALLESLGVQLKPEDFAPGKAPKDEFRNAMPSRKYTKDQEMIQAEATLLALHKLPKDWYLRNCKGCGEAFYVNYYFVAYCGDQCRAFALKKIGIAWTNHFDEPSKWQGRTPPMIIPPEALAAMKYLVDRAERENLRLAQTPISYSELPVSSLKQSPEHIVNHSPNESERVLLDKTAEIPSEPIESQTEDEFADLLAALGG